MTRVVFESNKVTAHKMPDGHVALILPPNAAQCLADITAVIGGAPGLTRRRYTARISHALSQVGVRFTTGRADMADAIDSAGGTAKSIYFVRDDSLGEDCLLPHEIEMRNRELAKGK